MEHLPSGLRCARPLSCHGGAALRTARNQDSDSFFHSCQRLPGKGWRLFPIVSPARSGAFIVGRWRYTSCASSQPRRLLTNAHCCTRGTSCSRSSPSCTRPVRSATARPTPGSKPQASGGVIQRPSSSAAMLPKVVSVISPAALCKMVSNTPDPAAGANAA
ncbi:hypothetical protein SDC9_199467 [bioreactor metagenome]|uniref:Uncharacterized protein n=1 Tax=bioreactor metagenome TaxID=1076179 RepID=A0A645IKJ9_9ZZZZ